MNKLKLSLLMFFNVFVLNLFCNENQKLSLCPYDFIEIMKTKTEAETKNLFPRLNQEELAKFEKLIKENNIGKTEFSKLLNEEPIENQEELKNNFFKLIKDATGKETEAEALQAIKEILKK